MQLQLQAPEVPSSFCPAHLQRTQMYAIGRTLHRRQELEPLARDPQEPIVTELRGRDRGCVRSRNHFQRIVVSYAMHCTQQHVLQ